MKNLVKSCGQQFCCPQYAIRNTPDEATFTGQWFDSQFCQYYLRARMYDPNLGRFTSRDPIFGKFKNPLTLHSYLYCLNDPVNRTDSSGEISVALIVVGGIVGGISAAINSGCDEWSDAYAISVGIATGMFAGMLPSSFMGYLGGGLLSAGNTAYATWIGGGDMDNLGTNLFWNAAGAGVGGPIGVLSGLGGSIAYLGSEGAGWFYSWFVGEIYEGAKSLFEDHVDDILQQDF